MQNYYIRIEDMPSLVSHQLSIIKYVVLKKIFFFLCFDRLIWTWTWTWTRTSLDSDSNLFGLGLDSDSNLFGLGLVLDSTKVDLTTALPCTKKMEERSIQYLRRVDAAVCVRALQMYVCACASDVCTENFSHNALIFRKQS